MHIDKDKIVLFFIILLFFILIHSKDFSGIIILAFVLFYFDRNKPYEPLYKDYKTNCTKASVPEKFTAEKFSEPSPSIDYDTKKVISDYIDYQPDKKYAEDASGLNTVDFDYNLSQKMIDRGNINLEAIHNRTRFTSDNFRKYYQEELDEKEKLHWWEQDYYLSD